MPDWVAWHEAYNRDTWLRERLLIVQARIREAVDAFEGDELRVVSMCAGEARDLEGALGGRLGPRIRGRVVELDPRNASVAIDTLAASGLPDVEVVCGDAAVTDSYAGAVPADLVLVCGVFGNIVDADVRSTIESLPMLCATGARVVWTRHRRAPDLTPAIRRWFADAGFEELSFDAPAERHYAVGVHRSLRPVAPLVSGRTLFSFVGSDALPQA